jgi:hypothetical protein
MILNADGISIGNHGVSGFRGLIRNLNGAWVQGSGGNIGFSNIFHAELYWQFITVYLWLGSSLSKSFGATLFLRTLSNCYLILSMLGTTMQLLVIILRISLLRIEGLKLFIPFERVTHVQTI